MLPEEFPFPASPLLAGFCQHWCRWLSLPLPPALNGHVAYHRDGTNDLSALVPYRRCADLDQSLAAIR